MAHAFLNLFRFLTGARLLKGGGVTVLVICLAAGCVWAGLAGYREFTSRTISVCVVSDFSFRMQKSNWQDQARLWFAEVNRAFEPASVQWKVEFGGDAYPERTTGSLDARRRRVEEAPSCNADVILALTGQPDRDRRSSVSPFAHTVLLAVTDTDSDAIATTALARSLAQLFGVPGGIQSVVRTDAPGGGLLDDTGVNIVRNLRRYDFRSGVAGLSGKWEKRALDGLESALAGGTPRPKVEAHLALAHAYGEASLHEKAIEHFRQATKADPADPLIRMELGIELAADAQDAAAIAEFKEVARRDPQEARAHAALGAIYLNMLQTAQAIEELQIATQLDPGNAEYQVLLGRAFLPQVGAAERAEQAFSTALKLQPRHVTALEGLTLLRNAPAASGSRLAELSAATRQAPNSSEARLELGLGLARAGETEQAQREIEHSIQLNPRNGKARAALAQLHFMAGRYDAAEAERLAAESAGEHVSAEFVEALRSRLAAKK